MHTQHPAILAATAWLRAQVAPVPRPGEDPEVRWLSSDDIECWAIAGAGLVVVRGHAMWVCLLGDPGSPAETAQRAFMLDLIERLGARATIIDQTAGLRS